MENGGDNPLIGLIVGDPDFRLTQDEVDPWLDPKAFTGRSVVGPALEGTTAAAVAAPRV